MAALPAGSTFKPLMTCYLTDDTDPDDVERGFRDGVFTGVKLYPANATTNSAAGVTDYRKIMPRAGAHGKDRHAVPDARRGRRSRRSTSSTARRCSSSAICRSGRSEFPGLRMILEHLSSKDGVDFVRSAAPQVGGTITPYHMMLTRTDWLGWGLKPYMYLHAGHQDRDGPRRRCARPRPRARPAISSAPIPRRIRWRGSSR